MRHSPSLRASEHAGGAAAALVAVIAGCSSVAREREPHPAQEPAPVGQNPEQVEEPAPGPDDAAAQPAAQSTRRSITGTLSTRVRSRWRSDESDSDLYEVLALDYASADHPWLTGHFLGRVEVDLDGAESSPALFTSLADTFDGSVDGQVYEAYADIKPADAFAEYRIGRQTDYLTPEFAFFDGVRAQSRELGDSEVVLGAYGGIPVHLYESSSIGDALFGLYAEGRPWDGGRARLDWMHFEDEYLGLDNSDDLFGAGLWQSFGAGTSLDAMYTRLEEASRDLRLAVQTRAIPADMYVRASYYELFEQQSDLALDLDPFTNALQEYEPFRRAGVAASTALGEHAGLELAFDARRVTDSSDVGEFNRDWERYYATVSAYDVLHDGLSLSLTGDQWVGDDRDIGTWGFSANQEIDKAWQASAGTYYSLYKYNLANNTERDDVRTFYVRGRWRKSERWYFDLIYEYEDDDFDQYHVVTAAAVWTF